MKNVPYWQKLKDPRWQRRRLEILERDGWACRGCRSTTKTLNVHHGYYERGLMPWEYPSETLWTLCDDCHEKAETSRVVVLRLMGMVDPAWDYDWQKVAGYITAGLLAEGKIQSAELGNGGDLIGALQRLASPIVIRWQQLAACLTRGITQGERKPITITELRRLQSLSREEYAKYEEIDRQYYAEMEEEGDATMERWRSGVFTDETERGIATALGIAGHAP